MRDNPRLVPGDNYWTGHFRAMASPCELLIDSPDREFATRLTLIAQQEALRIEHKFSRYRDDNIVYSINNSHGDPIEVDAETAALLDYADYCYQLSDGLFDITSGVLRRVWQFDGSDNIPATNQVESAIEHVGWPKISWQNPLIIVPEGMEIDLGGIGKEYAVDRSAGLLGQESEVSFLINYGGDLYANKKRSNGRGWVIGVEQPDINKSTSPATQGFELEHGGIATSGDARRYLLKDGVRYSHILNTLTGWPVRQAPHSVTVLANTCTEAGILATLAMLHGGAAEQFLEQQAVKYWVIR